MNIQNKTGNNEKSGKWDEIGFRYELINNQDSSRGIKPENLWTNF
jgi:hypothetical protein